MSERPQKPVFSPPKEDVLPPRAAKRVVGLLIALVIVVGVMKAMGVGS